MLNVNRVNYLHLPALAVIATAFFSSGCKDSGTQPSQSASVEQTIDAGEQRSAQADSTKQPAEEPKLYGLPIVFDFSDVPEVPQKIKAREPSPGYKWKAPPSPKPPATSDGRAVGESR